MKAKKSQVMKKFTEKEWATLRAYFVHLGEMYAVGVAAIDSGDFTKFVEVSGSGPDDVGGVVLTLKLSVALGEENT